MNNVDTSFAYILLQYKLRMFIRHTFSEATFVKLEAYVLGFPMVKELFR